MNTHQKLLLLLFALLLVQCTPKKSSQLNITVLGAAGEVSGSMILVEYQGSKVLVDCGAYYPDGNGSYNERQERANLRNLELPITGSSVDALIVTHAHLDHTGRIPLLFDQGFNGRVYSTPGTRTISEIMLLMQLRYSSTPRNWEYSRASIKKGFGGGKYVTAHWNNCRWSRNIKSSNLETFKGTLAEAEANFNLDFSPCYQCGKDELYPILNHFVVEENGKEVQISSNIWFEYFHAGHIPGSASVLMKFLRSPGDTMKLVFSGDIGNDLSPLIYGPITAPAADALFIESTYGGVQRSETVKYDIQRFQEDIGKVIRDEGIAWIPAFALDRTQKVLYAIKEGIQKGKIPAGTPIFCPSPSARNICELYNSEHQNSSQNWFRKEVYLKNSLFPEFIAKLPYEDVPRPAILITTSGMMDEAFSELMLDKLLPDPTTGVFQVGYQDPGSPGGQLKSSNTIFWKDKEIPVSAKIYSYSGFSAHGDFDDILDYLGLQNKDNVRLFLVHGDEDALRKQSNKLLELGYSSVKIAVKGEQITIN